MEMWLEVRCGSASEGGGWRWVRGCGSVSYKLACVAGGEEGVVVLWIDESIDGHIRLDEWMEG